MSIDGASLRRAPGAPTVVAASTQGASLGVQDTYITICAAGGALTFRFGDSAVSAAATTDWPLAEGEKEAFYVTNATNYVSIQGDGSLKVLVG